MYEIRRHRSSSLAGLLPGWVTKLPAKILRPLLGNANSLKPVCRLPAKRRKLVEWVRDFRV